jgi:phosphate transport system ATP-binding protein
MTSDGPPSRVADMEPESRTESGHERIRPQTPEAARVLTEPRGEDVSGMVDAKPGLSVRLEQLRAFYGEAEQVKGVDLDFRANQVTAIIGPSGCGKSTMVRCINRMHEEIPGARAEGKVLLDDLDLYDSSVDVVAVRRAIGMVFQKPNPFPTMSVFDNVAAGPRLSARSRGRGHGDLHAKVEAALRGAGLWEEVKDRLGEPGAGCASRARSQSIPR